MRVVLDTNVIVSGLFWTGPPARVLDSAIAKRFQVVISEAILAELSNVILRAKFNGRVARLPNLDRQTITEGLRDAFEVIHIDATERVVGGDPDDDAIVACAVAASADYIISGDNHLLSIGQYQGIKICTVDHFVSTVLPFLVE